jgi:predicted negative regulator of RcsB-dependent stress response
LFAGGLFGLGGGAAVVLAAISLNKFDMKSSDENIIYLIVLGVVAGFIGYRILPQVARGLERRMDITEKESRRALEDAMKAVNDAKVAKTSAEDAMKSAITAQKLTLAITLIGREDYHEAEKTLLDLKKNDHLSSVVTFNLSHIYKMKKDYNSAVKLVSEYIKDLRAANVDSGEKYAAALYNRACYRTLKAFSSGRDDVAIMHLTMNHAVRYEPKSSMRKLPMTWS